MANLVVQVEFSEFANYITGVELSHTLSGFA